MLRNIGEDPIFRIGRNNAFQKELLSSQIRYQGASSHMGFISEAEMKEVGKRIIGSTIRNKSMGAISEFKYPGGRTDLVYVDISDKYLDRRMQGLGITQPIQTRNHLVSFLQLHGRGLISKDRFFEIGALKRRYKRKALSWLIDNNFVIEQEPSKIRTVPNLRRHVTTAIAVELKLKDWRRALRQASRGRSFAEYRYVALDADNIAVAEENVHMFESSNVGLIGLRDSGECFTIFHPDRDRPHNDLYRWKVNETTVGAAPN